jgi:hypothetical protein
VIPLFLVAFDPFITRFFEVQYITEMVMIFIALEFWVTKNYTGRKMLGYRWFYG